MTNEELLKPRYKVIADYPSSLYGIGDEVEEHEPDNFHYQNCGDYQYASAQTLNKYPHLFKKMEWWEDREIGPYVKFTTADEVVEITKRGSVKSHNVFVRAFNDKWIGWINLYSCLPATESDYTHQNQSK